MIKDFLISFSDNIKEKTSNPFLGTYLLVWLIRNWDLVYTIFNFDKECNLDDKKFFIISYYKTNDFINNLAINILWTFAILISTYILLNISRFIVNVSEKRITPWIYKITDSKSIVLKSEYERIRFENDELHSKLDKERESKFKLESKIKNLEEEIIETTTISSGNKKQVSSTEIIYQKLKDKNLLQEFVDACTQINKGSGIPNKNEPKNYFVELGLIKFSSNYGSESKHYKITDIGQSVLEKIIMEN